MIARYWSATTANSPDRYRQHFQETVVPNLEALAGFRGCYLLEHASAEHGTKFVAVTLWESADHIKAFAGDDITRAHVEPEGQDALTDFDREAVNFTVSVHSDPRVR
jgi:heme-degrading monooxygenase HmoA